MSWYQADGVTLLLGDCVEVMREMPAGSVDAIVTDPPYELGFMGKGWDATGIANSVEMWAEALRVLKPGGHLAAFGGTRTYHRMACAIEDAGFEVRDCLAWMYGSGFPKSLDVSKAIDKAAGADREIVGTRPSPRRTGTEDVEKWRYRDDEISITAPATDAAREWEGWGTALKPAYEPIVLARKPLIGTVAQNVLTHGTGALNIDDCRIGDELRVNQPMGAPENSYGGYGATATATAGRWPANVLLDEEAAKELDRQSGQSGQSGERLTFGLGDGTSLHGGGSGAMVRFYGDRGGASRFFYTAKASRSEREAGLEMVAPQHRGDGRDPDLSSANMLAQRATARRNDHPTVKPVDLMRWLCRLVTPPGGVVLDCFNGSGTTGMAALDEGFSYIGIEREERYIEIARNRIMHRHLLEAQPVEPTAETPMGRLL